MKILCINTNGLRNDGITNSIRNYYGHMDMSDMTVDMLETRFVGRNVEQKFLDLGIRLKKTKPRNHVIPYIISTAHLIKKEGYDIVHIHGSSALLSLDLLAAWLGGCKVRIAHSRNTTCKHEKLDRLLRPIFDLLCTERFACGEDAGKWLFGNRAFSVINNGKDLDAFEFNASARERMRQKYHLEKYTVLGHVGNFNYQKNHNFLINVFADIVQKSDDYRLVLMGTGTEYLEKAKAQVRELGLEDKVFFMGSIDNVAEMLCAMDVMLLPSHYEGLPNVVLEWQLSGLPSFISDKITKECQVTELVHFLPIDKGTEIWVREITNTKMNEDYLRLEESKAARETLKKNGYDIQENAVQLKEKYKKFVQVREKGYI